jgi:tetratricopeptide (TPR) repeat protein
MKGARAMLGALVALSLVGCKFGPFPDPNDPSIAGDRQPEVLRRQVAGASDALLTRHLAGEITDAQYRDYLAKFTDDLLKPIKLESVSPSNAWQYGEVYRTARKWKEAEGLYRTAVSVAKDDDRRVNDTLSLAECLAQEGEVKKAIAEARLTFDTPPKYKAPILYGVLYRIVPGGQGKGRDGDLARLLEDAITQSGLTQVNMATDSGKAYVFALPHHQHNARELAAKLYLSVGKAADAERVLAGKLANNSV